MIQIVMTEGFLHDEHLAIDATHFESRDAAPTEKKEPAPPQKRGQKSKEERDAWLTKQAEVKANQSTYEKEIKDQLDTPLEALWQDAPIASKRTVTAKIRFGLALKASRCDNRESIYHWMPHDICQFVG
ncbi:hypothetical protein [Lysinibacillus pakistanensis]|uniref:Transposase n=1 Tax=Lysinibacillus pakistanensis TaxID=759811 RepID=A0ABX6D4B7_9BACI|nr:hypothetical protein GDS87_01035 [Lysinibacillus pakistanensis]